MYIHTPPKYITGISRFYCLSGNISSRWDQSPHLIHVVVKDLGVFGKLSKICLALAGSSGCFHHGVA